MVNGWDAILLWEKRGAVILKFVPGAETSGYFFPFDF
jgi:hypothetical protein